jgi:hypothetical protein
MTTVPFTRTRPTIVAAVALMAKMGQAAFNHAVLRLGLEDEIASVAKVENRTMPKISRKRISRRLYRAS